MSLMDVSLVVIAYLVGAVPFGVLVARFSGCDDLREQGSGNIGATNVARVLGKRAGAFTLAFDLLKGLVPVLVTVRLSSPEVAVMAATAAVLGHVFPVYLGFRGGKGVATGFGVLMALNFPTALASLAIWIAAAKLSGISAMGALVSYGSLPLVAWWLGPEGVFLPFACALTLLIYVRHTSNIRGLIRGWKR
ncbi:MAG: glycerol-3-phosphate 1-O-acyltransferase PlsY [Leptospirillia bacterium]